MVVQDMSNKKTLRPSKKQDCCPASFKNRRDDAAFGSEPYVHQKSRTVALLLLKTVGMMRPLAQNLMSIKKAGLLPCFFSFLSG